ncbi:Cysteine proteinase [Fasciola gigantica]|uniref:Cysteine proteinase n=1 Tax=Fasciola gigantica TaxID=46835 RepID=A0A504YQZ3_FASGI|nr:Cysteine proteinase [Fasciola gigantica]
MGYNEHRRNVWEKNVKHIQEHNLRHDLGLVTYTLGLNQFTDLTFEEFKAKYLVEMPPVSELLSNSISYDAKDGNVPASIDWRQYGYVTEVKDQGKCGSCWAFSVVGAMEGQYFKKFKTLETFSVQQLVDCTRRFGNRACLGGYMEYAYKYLNQSGLERESTYPQQPWEYNCRHRKQLGIARVPGFHTVYSGDEMKLMQMVGKEGPASVAVDAQSDFYMYQNGIYQAEACSSRYANHALLAVGYGTQSGTDYWILKNSWGLSWGEDGYMRFARNRGNMCAIATLATVPMVERCP